MQTDTDVCPVCHTDRQFNKNLRLLVSPCYHKMYVPCFCFSGYPSDGRCESCIDRLFTLGPEPCPQCGRILRKVNFAHQTFEDLRVEKEVAVRRRMAELWVSKLKSLVVSASPSSCYGPNPDHSFNKRREDFGSDREHDDYLEEVEDLSE
jgi:CDK-activating kinase assembly factor MAT1